VTAVASLQVSQTQKVIDALAGPEGLKLQLVHLNDKWTQYFGYFAALQTTTEEILAAMNPRSTEPGAQTSRPGGAATPSLSVSSSALEHWAKLTYEKTNNINTLLGFMLDPFLIGMSNSLQQIASGTTPAQTVPGDASGARNVTVSGLQGATQWLAEIRNSLYYFVGLPWPELIRGVLGWDSGRPLTTTGAPTVASAGTATLDIAPLVSAVSGSGKEVSGGITALREAFLGFAGDNIGSLADLRGYMGRITDPLADIRGMVREFTSLPWRPALDKVASRTHQTMLVLELDGRELARGIVDDITSEQVLRLKLSGQAVF
jgi:hypothetical protein